MLDDLNIVHRACLKADAPPFDARKFFQDYYIQNWSSESSTGLSAAAPSDYLELCSFLMRGIQDAIYFSGEHLSVNPGWMLGSLTSTAQALEKITKTSPLRFLAYRKEENGNSHRGDQIPIFDISN